MTTLKNVKFTGSMEQLERVVEILEGQGYRLCGDTRERGAIVVYDYQDFRYLNTGHHYDNHPYPAQDTEAFIAQHSDIMVNMCFRDSPEGKAAFKGLEDAYDEPHSEAVKPLITGSPWVDNDGTMPDLPVGTLVEIAFKGGDVGSAPDIVENWAWEFEGQWDEIAKWRFHRPEDSEYYQQPKTEFKVNLPNNGTSYGSVSAHNAAGDVLWTQVTEYPSGKTTTTIPASTLEAGSVKQPETANSFSVDYTNSEDAPIVGYTFTRSGAYDMLTKEIPESAIDTHYNFSYELTQDDVDEGYIKVDPYFVSQQWQLGSKDSTGVIFHIMKNISRFGDKNTKEREIIAIYKSILRLAQLEGVELK